MDVIVKLREIKALKFSFGKSDEYHHSFCKQIDAYSMYDAGYGLGISTQLSPENQLRAVFSIISSQNGIFVFNINGVDIKKAGIGFADYDEAESNNMITEWELSIILANSDFIEQTIFHNGKVEFIQYQKSLKVKWL